MRACYVGVLWLLQVCLATQLHLKVAVLLTGKRPNAIQKEFGTNAQAFHRFLESTGSIEVTEMTSFDCWKHEFPGKGRLNEYDLLVIPGASHSVLEDLAWMRFLEQVVTDVDRKPWVLGTCFGHQLVAKAYGGVVASNEKGWEVGATRVSVFGLSGLAEMTVLQSHKMHVTAVPGDLQVWCGNDHSPVQGLYSAKHRVFTFQFHPEYSKEYYYRTRHRRPMSDAQLREAMLAHLDSREVVLVLSRILAVS